MALVCLLPKPGKSEPEPRMGGGGRKGQRQISVGPCKPLRLGKGHRSQPWLPCRHSCSPPQTCTLGDARCCFLAGRVLRQSPHTLEKGATPLSSLPGAQRTECQEFNKRVRGWEQMADSSMITAPAPLTSPTPQGQYHDMACKGPTGALGRRLQDSVAGQRAINDTTPAPWSPA